MCRRCAERPSTFRPSNITTSEVKSVIPARLFAPDTATSLYYLARDIVLLVFLAAAIWVADSQILAYREAAPKEHQVYVSVVRGIAWSLYWWFQSLTFSALWLLAHECGHGAFSPYKLLNDSVGFVLHSLLGTPYYSWKYSHRQHHRFNGHVDKDEHFIPEVLDEDKPHGDSGFWDSVEDTPIYQLIALVIQQIIGFQSYLIFNVSGQRTHPRGTSHYNPFSVIFRPSQRFDIFLSDIGVFAAIGLVSYAVRTPPLNAKVVMALYGVPWVLLNHWVAMIVLLQHIDVVLPRYRDKAYNYARGALVTVDRAFLGWQGTFFLHDVAHYHVVHHFFPKMPFYHLKEATEYAKKVLGDNYISCDTPVFQALWDVCLKCRFVDAKGDIVFYKDKAGNTRFRYAVEAEGEAPKH